MSEGQPPQSPSVHGAAPAARSGPPLSPCIRVCVMDAAGRHCTGCRRTLSEIARWWTMRDDEKRAVLAELPARGPHGPHHPGRPGAQG